MKKRPDAKKSFDSTIKGLANPNAVKNAKEQQSIVILARFIERTLIQFHLKKVEIFDVIAEVYIRGEKLISSGEDIKSPGAWIRVTSYNVIREMSREQQKEVAYSESIELQFASENPEETNELKLNLLKQLLQTLDEKDRQILDLRFLQNLSWKQVVTHLATKGEVLTEATARQKGKRALERLKKAFFSVQSDQLSA